MNLIKRYKLLFLNLIIIIINIFFLNKKKFHFKNSDEYIFYNLKNFSFPKQKLEINYSMPKINISLICKDNLNNTACSNNIKQKLEKLNYIVYLDDEHPDYLIYDVFGCEHINPKYDESIKIALYSENIIPDFSETDYATSQAHLIYLDRYYKYPSFIWNLYKFRKLKVGNIRMLANNLKKTKFCAAVISNYQNYSYFRLNFIKELNKYKHVDMGGDYLNDFGIHIQDKIKFLSSYKFSISMENSNGDGYISEKIIDSLIAGTIPIYYGDYLIDEYINPKCLIMIKGEKDIQSKIDYIIKIDNDDKLYNSILKEPIFLNDNYIDIMRKIEKEQSSFFYHIFLQDKKRAKRIDDINKIYNCVK